MDEFDDDSDEELVDHPTQIGIISGIGKAAGVPVFVKQLGSKPIGREQSALVSGCDWDNYAAAERQQLSLIKDRKGGDMDEFPEDLRVREFPEVQS